MKAIEIAMFFLALDHENMVFQKNLVSRNGRKFYDGNAKLNKFLHLAQNIFIAKYGKLLFSDSLYAYDNGAVVPSVLERYAYIRENKNKFDVRDIPDDIAEFLRKFFAAFKNATLDEMITLSHEDAAWKEKCAFFAKKDQKMNTLGKADQYKIQYADIIKVMDRMGTA